MKLLPEFILGVPALILWILGIIISVIKIGTTIALIVAVVFPPYAWFLVAEQLFNSH